MKLLFKIMYDGRAYHGFQVQPNGISVQEALCCAGEKFFGFPVAVTGCSRTDSGVHALGFCATVSPRDAASPADWCTVPVSKLHRALSPYLPDDISVIAAARVENDFHPRYCAVEKEYIYKTWDKPYKDPFLRGRAYMTCRSLGDDDISRMNSLAEAIVGRRDFTSFMAAGSKIECAVRDVRSAAVTRDTDGTVCLRISADGFLYNMVRIIVGTLLEMTYKKMSPADMERVICARDRSAAGATAPPEGLYLRRVEYDRVINWECN